MPKFCAAYLETNGDESICADTTFGIDTDDDTAADTNANGFTLINQNYGFVLKPKKLVKQYQ